MEPLHEDDQDTVVDTAGGPVRNLTAEEYATSYATGEPHRLPDDVLAQVDVDVAARAVEQQP